MVGAAFVGRGRIPAIALGGVERLVGAADELRRRAALAVAGGGNADRQRGATNRLVWPRHLVEEVADALRDRLRLALGDERK